MRWECPRLKVSEKLINRGGWRLFWALESMQKIEKHPWRYSYDFRNKHWLLTPFFHNNLIILSKVFTWRSGMPQLMTHCYLTLKKPTSLTFHLLSSPWRLFKPQNCWKRSSSSIKGFFYRFLKLLINCSILAIQMVNKSILCWQRCWDSSWIQQTFSKH